MYAVLSLLTLKELVFEVGEACLVDTSVLFVATIHLFSQAFNIGLQCGGLLLNVILSYSIARCIRWPGLPDQTFLSLCHQRQVAALCMLYKVNLNSNHCLFSELPFASVKVGHTRAAAVAHPFEFEVSRCRTSQFARCFLPPQIRVWNDLPYTVFDTGTLDGFKGAVNRWLHPRVCFPVFCDAGDCGVEKAIYKQFFSHFGLCSWFYY